MALDGVFVIYSPSNEACRETHLTAKIMSPIVLKLDMVKTLALAAVVLFSGYAIRRRVGVLDRYNIPAPRAFLVVPMVGAFFIDFTNALIITEFINLVT